MVSVQHPAAAATAFWPATASHSHVFALPAAQQVGSLVPQWHHHYHHHLPSSNGSCVSVTSHALAGHRRHLHGHTPGGAAGGGDSLGALGQALVSSAAAFLPPQLAGTHHHPPAPPSAAICPPPLSQQVLLSPRPYAGGPVLSLSVPQRQAAITMVDPEQPIGYGSFGVVWYVSIHAITQRLRCGTGRRAF